MQSSATPSGVRPPWALLMCTMCMCSAQGLTGDEMAMLQVGKGSEDVQVSSLLGDTDHGDKPHEKCLKTYTTTSVTVTTTTQTTATITTTLRSVQLVVEKLGMFGVGVAADDRCVALTPFIAEESFTLDFQVDVLNAINYNPSASQPLDLPLVAKWQEHPGLTLGRAGFEVRLVTQGTASPYIKLRMAFGGVEKTAHGFVDLTGTDGWVRVSITYSRVAQVAKIMIDGKLAEKVNRPPPFGEGPVIEHIGTYPNTYVAATLTDFCFGTDNQKTTMFNSELKDIRFFRGIANLNLASR